jgi:putative NADH-flavin reductase
MTIPAHFSPIRIGMTLDGQASPTGNFDHDGPRVGHYRIGGPAGTGLISYADFAIALLDEIDTPKHHRTQIAFTN